VHRQERQLEDTRRRRRRKPRRKKQRNVQRKKSNAKKMELRHNQRNPIRSRKAKVISIEGGMRPTKRVRKVTRPLLWVKMDAVNTKRKSPRRSRR